MKKIKINIDRTPVSKEEIAQKRNFEQVLAQVKAFTLPFYKTKLFLNGIAILFFASVVLYTVTKLEKEAETTTLHENDGYLAVSTAKEIGSIDSLQTQEFVVQINRDTILRTAEGAVIKITAGSLTSTDKNVVLLVKEAYTMEDMIRAGLTTKSGKELLSSGGMFYIQAKDSSNVRIAKPISFYIPTDDVNSNMKLFQGQTTLSGNIDWQDPVKMSLETEKNVLEGESLFKNNCKSCHVLGKDTVGPDLAYIAKRRDYDWITRYVQNSTFMMNQACGNRIFRTVKSDTAIEEEAEGIYYNNEEYAICLKNAYNKSVMPNFSTFTDKEIKALCYYLNTESERLKLPYPKDELYIDFQKCKTYKALMSSLNAQKSKLKSKRVANVFDNGAFVKQVDQSMQLLQQPNSVTNMSVQERKSLIHVEYKQSEYYQVEISTFGWFNIDMLATEGLEIAESKLFVQVSDSFANKFQIYFVLPDAKIYGAGGLLKDKKDLYGFYEDNGDVTLPQGKTAHVYLVGEKDGMLLYAATTFVTGTLNNLRLNPEAISKEAFNKKIKELLQVKGMSVTAKDSKNASAIRKIDSDINALDEKIKEAKKSEPKDCDCGCVGEMEYAK